MTLEQNILQTLGGLADGDNEIIEDEKIDFVKIGIASPQRILGWSHGEVTKPETINYRTLKPERDGLFCERIFGPAKDWECHCGKYKKVRHRGIVCERCGVEVTDSKVRRYRMGHIKLAAPVAHIWYLKGVPNHISLLLDLPSRTVEDIAYYNKYVVVDPGTMEGLSERQELTEEQYEELMEQASEYGKHFEADMGAGVLRRLLGDLKLDELGKFLREEILNTIGQKRTKLIKRLRVVESFINSKINPTWMVLDVLPIIPPDLRPMVQLDGGRFATSDLNDLYRRVINRNNRLIKLLEMEAPDIIIRNEKRMLQEAVDALIDNGRRGRVVVGPNNRPLKSLSDIIEGKQGRFRQNLLGKRVDYSGRSVIVVGPKLKLHQCGLPKEMALELFKPFVMNKLVERNIVQNIKSAKKKIERQETIVWDVLEDVIKGHPVMLNRAPTLHRLGIQAFEPILVEGRAIQLHPLVCAAFNADFDGDQMAVHVPLSIEAQTEARVLMLAINNILLPATGKPTITPTHDMVLGCYYITVDNPETNLMGQGSIYASTIDAVSAYQSEKLNIHAKVKVRFQVEELDPEEMVYTSLQSKAQRQALSTIKDKKYVFVETTVGKIIFNEVLPPDFHFYNKVANKGALMNLISQCYLKHGNVKTAEMANSMKDLGFKYATKSGLSISIEDLVIPPEKKEILERARKSERDRIREYQRGEITEVERYSKVINIWSEATEELTNLIIESSKVDRLNSVYMMAFSGARGNLSQVRQLIGMRGLMADPQGKIIELPIESNFKEGLTVTEYIISSYGARKGLVDTALRTADSGYLTRRLADVAQEVIIKEDDCGTDRWLMFKEIKDRDKMIVSLKDRLVGRTTAQDIYKETIKCGHNGKIDKIDATKVKIISDEGKKVHVDIPSGFTVLFKEGDLVTVSTRIAGKDLLVSKGQEITPEKAIEVNNTGITQVMLRSPVSCANHYGVCRKCYGWSLTNNRMIDIGESIGIIAAQSIGEPGTQLTMRTFHTGGVFSRQETRSTIKAGKKGKVKYDKNLEITQMKTANNDNARVTEKEGIIYIVTKENKQTSIKIPAAYEIRVEEGATVSSATIVAESIQESATTSRKSVEKGYKDIIANISGQIKFSGFHAEVKKDRQGTMKIANKKGVIWVANGEVYTLPSNSEIIVKDKQKIQSGDCLARISTTSEFGGQVRYTEDQDGRKKISIITAELNCNEADIIAGEKENHLVFADEYPVNKFQLFATAGSRIEDKTIIAEAFDERYILPVNGEIKYLKVETTEKQTITGKSELAFLPCEQFATTRNSLILVEENGFVEAGTEIIEGVTVDKPGFVSLESLELSQQVIFYPDAKVYKFPPDTGAIKVEEGDIIAKKAVIGTITNPETEEEKSVVSDTKGIVKIFFSGEVGKETVTVVVRPMSTYSIEPLKKFYTCKTSHESIDLVPVTRLVYRDGDYLKAGSSLVKINLAFRLLQPLSNLGGLIVFDPKEGEGEEEIHKLKICVVESPSLRKERGIEAGMSQYELNINTDFLVEDNVVIKPGTVIVYTEYLSSTDGIVVRSPNSSNELNKILIFTDDNEVAYKLSKTSKTLVKEGQEVNEGDLLADDVTALEGGIVETVSKTQITVRKARPYLVNQGTQLMIDNGDLVQKGEVVATLVYEQYKTGDIIQGLPRVEELLECRKPKDAAILVEHTGTIKMNQNDELVSIVIVDDNNVEHSYSLPSSASAIVIDGQRVKAGDQLTDGPINPHDILRVVGIEAVQQYLIEEVQSVYRSQGVEIADKHIEVIVRQMTKKLRVDDAGDTIYLPGEIINSWDIARDNAIMKGKDLRPCETSPVLLGITKASLNTDSFISAASFQETTRVLTEAAVEGKKDYLRGLKENVIIGRLIPAGTGVQMPLEEDGEAESVVE